MTTEVSSRPLKVSATRSDFLIGVPVEVRPQPLIVNPRSAAERGSQRRTVHDAASP